MKADSFHEACRSADLPLLRSLLETDPSLLNSLDHKYGWTPLSRAIICDHSDVVKFLLKQGADPNCTTAVGEPPLYLAVDLQHTQLTQLLLDFGADPNAGNADGETPLHLAAFKGLKAEMELLLSHGANPDLVDFVVRKHVV